MLYANVHYIAYLFTIYINADLEPKTHHQTPMTCTYGFSHLDTSKTVATEMEIQFLNMNYVPIVVATYLEVHFFCSKEGGCPNTFVYIVYVQVIGVW